MGERLLAEPLRLHRVIAVRDAGIGVAHRRDQRIDHLLLDPVGEVARIGDVDKTAPAVRDLLVLGQRVGDEREQPHIPLEHLRQGLGGAAALCFVRIEQAIERGLKAELLAIGLESERRHRLVEEPVPGASRRHRFLVEQLLELVVELIGLLLAQILEPRTVMAELGFRHRRLELGIVEAVQLERKEQELRGDGGDLLLDVAEEFLPLGVGGIGGIEQARIGHDAAHDVVERLELTHGFRQPRPPFAAIEELGELAGIAVLHGIGRALGGLEIGLELGRIRPLVEIGKLPFGQRPELRLSPPFGNFARLRSPFGGDGGGKEGVL